MTENREPLVLAEIDQPAPRRNEVLIEVSVCGVCHTELDEIEGRTPPSTLPMVPGHQVVGTIVEAGPAVTRVSIGDRVGVAWIYSACGKCEMCLSGQENLCPDFKATGRDKPGGYAEYMCAEDGFVYTIPTALEDSDAAPLLCAGAIGYRSLRLANIRNGDTLGLTGFGGSGHLVLKMVKNQYPDTRICVFARNPDERAFARDLGAAWAGDTSEDAPFRLDAIIDTTPAWKPVVEALTQLKPGGRLVINAIRKEAGDKSYLLNLDYPEHLWMEKEIKSVANVTRRDVIEFLELAASIPIHPDRTEYPLQAANSALTEMKEGKIRGAKVLRIHE